MSGERLDAILDAAYQCFARHGARRTTMDDIALAAGLSRPAVYQYVRNKDDVFERLCRRMFDAALARARAAAIGPGDRVVRLEGVLGTKLELVLKLFKDSPHHAAELIGEGARISAPLGDSYRAQMRLLVADVLDGSTERAEILLAFVRGLESDVADPDATRDRLRQGIEIFTAGLEKGSRR